MKNTLTILLILSVLLIPALTLSEKHYAYARNIVDTAQDMLAAAGINPFFSQGITPDELKNKFNQAIVNDRKIQVLIVPGHEPHFGGTEFGDLKERDMAVDVAQHLKTMLETDPRYRVMVARTKDSWDPILDTYFRDNWSDIENFRTNAKSEMSRLLEEGKIVQKTDGVYHNNAPLDSAIRLFGINKWSNENGVDIAIHIHFNDVGGRGKKEGDYNGFSVYVPDRQYSNAELTKEIGNNVYRRLTNLFPVSNLPKENEGVVEDQELVAIGQGNTSKAASLLVEYGYIYEPQYQSPMVRALMMRELAYQTYLGFQDFFGADNTTGWQYATTLLPYSWNRTLGKDTFHNADVLALQTAFVYQGVYPPGEQPKNDCPITGNFGPCTVAALKLFQDKYGITNERGVLGIKTRAELNSLFNGIVPMELSRQSQ